MKIRHQPFYEKLEIKMTRTSLYTEIFIKICLNSDGKQFHQYQQRATISHVNSLNININNEQLSLTSSYWTSISTTNNYLWRHLIEHQYQQRTTISHVNSLNININNEQLSLTSTHWTSISTTNNYLSRQLIEHQSNTTLEIQVMAWDRYKTMWRY